MDRGTRNSYVVMPSDGVVVRSHPVIGVGWIFCMEQLGRNTFGLR